MKEGKVPGLLIAFGKGGKPSADGGEESSEESPGKLAVQAFFKHGNKGEWDDAWDALQTAVAECDHMADAGSKDEDSEEE